MAQEIDPRKLFRRYRSDFELRDPSDQPGRDGGEDARQKIRVSAGSNPIGQQGRIPPGVPTVTDTLQNSRMDDIERAIRTLTDDMMRNRTTFAQLLEELRDGGETSYHTPPPGNGHAHSEGGDSEVAYLVGRVERNVEQKFNELQRAWSVLGDRLKQIETVIEEFDGGEAARAGFTPELEQRLKGIGDVGDRLDKLDAFLTSMPGRLTEMERRLQLAIDNNDIAFDDERLIAKLSNVEKLIQESPDGHFEMGPVLASLRDVEAGLRGVGGQMREVDSRSGDVSLSVEALSERQSRMEELIEAQQALILGLKDQLRDGAGHVAAGPAISAEQVASAVGERLAGLSSEFYGRIGQIEELARAALDRPLQAVSASGDADVSYINDAMGKVINNQHTLASSIDEWMVKSQLDFEAVQTRINAIDDKLSLAPEVTPVGPGTGRAIAPEPVDGWSRFKLWLFGTTDWYGVSWDGTERDGDRGWSTQRRTAREGDEAAAPGNERKTPYDSLRA